MHIVRILNFLGLLGIACLVAARSPQHVGKRFPKPRSEVVSRFNPAAIAARSPAERRNQHRYLNHKTKSKSVGCCYATIRANNYQNSLLMENAFLMWILMSVNLTLAFYPSPRIQRRTGNCTSGFFLRQTRWVMKRSRFGSTEDQAAVLSRVFSRRMGLSYGSMVLSSLSKILTLGYIQYSFKEFVLDNQQANR